MEDLGKTPDMFEEGSTVDARIGQIVSFTEYSSGNPSNDGL